MLNKLFSICLVGLLYAITADGYDTAFFIMGMEKTKAFISSRKDLDIVLIYTEPNGALMTNASPGIQNFITPIATKQ